MVAAVTGGTSGIGLAVSKILAANGYTVYAMSRKKAEIEGVKHIVCDVTDEAAVNEAISGIVKAEGSIDVVVNCAGFGISGACEFTELNDVKRLFDTDFFGTVNVNKAVIPYMRKKGSGKIINISSVAAPVAIPFQTYYSAAKAAINSYTCALANEIKPFGIQVCAVMPGDTKTGFTGAREKSPAGDEEYSGRISRSVSRMEKDEINGVDPSKVGKLVYKLAKKKHVKPLYTVGFSYKIVTVLVKILPCGIANRVIYGLYSK